MARNTKKSVCFYNPETGDQSKDLWLGLTKACRKARLKSVTWHIFRHTFASRLTRGGADLVTVQRTSWASEHNNNHALRHTNRGAKKRAARPLEVRSDKTVTVSEPEKESA
jgi:integrase